MHNVLIVDEESQLLSTLAEELFPDRDNIHILTATDGEAALEHLRQSAIDLLISDIKMPGKVDGFQLILRAKEIAPDARVIIITAFGSHRVQNFADRIGITHYIEKPFDMQDLREAVLEILDEKEGFQGVLNDLELTDIIQMLCLARRTALLHLKHRDRRGRIVFEQGEVTHATFDELVGEDAIYRMLALRQGDIFMQSDFRNDQRTIELGWQDLLFEGVRRADEERANLVDEPSEAEEGPGTDVGMGISANDLAKIEDIISESMETEAFFSADELAEIEGATDDHALPFASFDDDSLVDTPSHDEFRSPFRRETSAVTHTTTGLPTLATVAQAAVESRIAKFAQECPGIKESLVINMERRAIVAQVVVEAAVDAAAFTTSCADLASAARRIVESLGGTAFRELHVSIGDDFLLMSMVPDSPFCHVALVGGGVSLGVALVMMQRLQHGLSVDLERS